MPGIDSMRPEHPNSFLIISPGHYARFVSGNLTGGGKPIRAKEFKITDIGRYLIALTPIFVSERLVGCQITSKKPEKVWLKRFNAWRSKPGDREVTEESTQILLSSLSSPLPTLATSDLEQHFRTIHDQLKSYDHLYDSLEALDHKQISKVMAICEDDTGNQTQVNLGSDVSRTLFHIKESVGNPIEIRLERAQIANGLFDLRGFDFHNMDPQRWYRLLTFSLNGEQKACVLNMDHTIAFWLENVEVIHWLQLVEQSIRQNPQMHDSFRQCLEGKAKPMRLMFNDKIEIDYQNAPLPNIFKEICQENNLFDIDVSRIKENLKRHQVMVSFNTIPIAPAGRTSVCTDMSIFQDIRALTSLKDRFPLVYAELVNRAEPLETGKYYVLDMLRGYRDAA